MNIKKLERETRKEYFKFYNELAEKYPESKIVYSTKMGLIREQYLIILLKKNPEELTLDLGCNDGHYKPHIQQYVGLDSASACLKKFSGHRIWAIAQQLPFRNNVFGRLFASEVLEHIWDRKQVLGECRRILRPLGIIIVSVPYGKDPYQKSRESSTRKLRKYEVKYPQYVHGKFSKEDLQLLLKQSGFRIIYITQIKNFNIVATAVKP